MGRKDKAGFFLSKHQYNFFFKKLVPGIFDYSCINLPRFKT
jgi:hypothetical protein